MGQRRHTCRQLTATAMSPRIVDVNRRLLFLIPLYLPLQPLATLIEYRPTIIMIFDQSYGNVRTAEENKTEVMKWRPKGGRKDACSTVSPR